MSDENGALDQSNRIHDTEVAGNDNQHVASQHVAEPMTADELRRQVIEGIRQVQGQVFKCLQQTGTESLLVYLVAINLKPLVRTYESFPAAITDLTQQIWPKEFYLFERYLSDQQLKSATLAACINALLASDRLCASIFETLLIFTNSLSYLEMAFHSQEWLLLELRSELQSLQREGQFQRLQVSLPSEQLAPSGTSRGDLQLQVSASKPTIVAGEEFSIFTVVSNPFEVPVVLYAVETQIPVELTDRVEQQRRRLIALSEYQRERGLLDEHRSKLMSQKIYNYLRTWGLIDLLFSWGQLFLDESRIKLKLAAQPENRIAQAVAPSEVDQRKGLEINVQQQIGTLGDRGTVIGAQIERYQPIDIRIDSVSPQQLDSLLWRFESFRRGLTPIVLQPGDSVVKQFIFRTKEWLFFTPLAHTMQIQVRYSADNRDHLDTVPFALTIQAAITATMVGAIIGGAAGAIARLLTDLQSGNVNAANQVLSVTLAVIFSAITVVSFARKTGVQQIISIEDFWGGLFLGFLIGFLGQSFALNLITPNAGGAAVPKP